MHWKAVQAIVTDCEAYWNHDGPLALLRHDAETFSQCIVELAAQLRRANAALLDETKRLPPTVTPAP